jgi:hypothetical protein
VRGRDIHTHIYSIVRHSATVQPLSLTIQASVLPPPASPCITRCSPDCALPPRLQERSDERSLPLYTHRPPLALLSAHKNLPCIKVISDKTPPPPRGPGTSRLRTAPRCRSQSGPVYCLEQQDIGRAFRAHRHSILATFWLTSQLPCSVRGAHCDCFIKTTRSENVVAGVVANLRRSTSQLPCSYLNLHEARATPTSRLPCMPR